MPSAPIKITGIFYLLLTLVAIGGCTTPVGDPEAGEKWFAMHNCSSCHGPNGTGGRAVPIDNLDMGFGSFLRKLRTTDAPIMPPFPASKISEQDAADIYIFLKSREKLTSEK